MESPGGCGSEEGFICREWNDRLEQEESLTEKQKTPGMGWGGKATGVQQRQGEDRWGGAGSGQAEWNKPFYSDQKSDATTSPKTTEEGLQDRRAAPHSEHQRPLTY